MRTFRGGIHTSGHKALSCDRPIAPFPAPQQVVLPLSQHIGVPCVPTVEKGEAVKLGQVVGQPDPASPKRFVSAPIHASVSGTVATIEYRPHPLGKPTLAVVIDNDGQDTWADGLLAGADPADFDDEAIKNRILDAGIVGMGGATFPTHVKLSPPPDTKIDTLILNAAECESYLTCDYRLMIEHPAELVEGLQLLANAVDATNLVIGIEANKPDAYAALSAAAEGTGIRVEMCKVKYPQGAEKQLIHTLTGRKVPAGGLPLAVGVVVQNVGTAYAVYEAVRRNKPLVERVVTVTGDGVETPANYLVRLGTPVGALLGAAGLRDDARRVILGGPMMGLAQYTSAVPVIKGTSGVLVLRDAEPAEWRACISCGRCVEACPMRLMPNEISIACESGNVDAIAATTIMDCFECGACTYVCPGKRPIVHWVKFGKAELAKRRAQEPKPKAG